MGLTKFVREVMDAPHYRKKPGATLRYAYAKWVFHRFRQKDPRLFLAGVGIDVDEALDGFEQWRSRLERVVSTVRDASDGQGGISLEDGMVLYGLTRALGPEYVVETGVAAGVSTSFFGAALMDNGHGKLFSIELPPANHQRIRLEDGSIYAWQNHGLGWAMPEEIARSLGDLHELILQDVRTGLPELLRRIPHVDLFFHDDLHTPDHMLWEYALVWPKVRPGGVLVSDDVNHGWIKFCNRQGLNGLAFSNIDRLCALRKPGPESSLPSELCAVHAGAG
jgi:hypothetical protein